MSNIQVVAGAERNEFVAEVVTDAGSLVWMLTMPSGEGAEATMSDTELAQNLGYKEVRAIRKTIKRLIDDRELECVLVRDTVSRARNRYGEATSGRTVQEYRLTLSQAITVAQASEAPKAPMVRGVLKEMFLHWRNGKLLPPPTNASGEPVALPANDSASMVRRDEDVALLRQALQACQANIDVVVQRNEELECRVIDLVDSMRMGGDEQIGESAAKLRITDPLFALAMVLHNQQPEPQALSVQSLYTRLSNDVRAVVGFPSTTVGNAWSRLPKRLLFVVENWIHGHNQRAFKDARQRCRVSARLHQLPINYQGKRSN